MMIFYEIIQTSPPFAWSEKGGKFIHQTWNRLIFDSKLMVLFNFYLLQYCSSNLMLESFYLQWIYVWSVQTFFVLILSHLSQINFSSQTLTHFLDERGQKYSIENYTSWSNNESIIKGMQNFSIFFAFWSEIDHLSLNILTGKKINKNQIVSYVKIFNY